MGSDGIPSCIDTGSKLTSKQSPAVQPLRQEEKTRKAGLYSCDRRTAEEAGVRILGAILSL